MVPASGLVSFQAIRAWNTELARYAKAEYGHPDAGWILTRLEPRRARAKVGWRALLHRRREAHRPPAPAVVGLEAQRRPAEAAASAGRRELHEPGACDHPELELLGSGGPTTYYRCTVCGRVVIQNRESLFVIRPSVGAATSDVHQPVAVEVVRASIS